jgi:hypothetical protein
MAAGPERRKGLPRVRSDRILRQFTLPVQSVFDCVGHCYRPNAEGPYVHFRDEKWVARDV